jgi:hypothetical protein
MKNSKKYPPLETDSPWTIYKQPQQIPIESEKLAEITVICVEGVSKNCDSISIFSNVEIESKKIGGNALLIRKHKQPSLWNSSYQLNADIIKVFDFLSPPDSLYTKRKPKITEIYGKGIAGNIVGEIELINKVSGDMIEQCENTLRPYLATYDNVISDEILELNRDKPLILKNPKSNT